MQIEIKGYRAKPLLFVTKDKKLVKEIIDKLLTKFHIKDFEKEVLGKGQITK